MEILGYILGGLIVLVILWVIFTCPNPDDPEWWDPDKHH